MYTLLGLCCSLTLLEHICDTSTFLLGLCCTLHIHFKFAWPHLLPWYHYLTSPTTIVKQFMLHLLPIIANHWWFDYVVVQLVKELRTTDDLQTASLIKPLRVCKMVWPLQASRTMAVPQNLSHAWLGLLQNENLVHSLRLKRYHHASSLQYQKSH